jgi:glycosyltransferase involved in cell wall biosynthesis
MPTARLDIAGRHPPICQEGVVGHGYLRLDVASDRGMLDRLFAAATCFVMPSRYEPSAIAYVEAATAGLPVIGTTEGGSALLIGAGGILVHPDDEPGLLDAMMHVSQSEVASALGAAARENACRFTWELVAQRLLRAMGLPHPRGGLLAPFL